MPRAYLIYNPAAGRYPSWLLTERAAGVLRKRGWQIRVERTKDGDHVTLLARQAVEEGMDAFFIVGGDGSVNRSLPSLVGSQTAIGILPAGTGNVWGQELGLPGLTWTRVMALEESARRLAQAKVCEVDVGSCNDVLFLLWAGVGLDGFIVNRIEPRSRWEKNFAVVQYAASAVWNASRWHGIHLNVVTDEKRIKGHFLLAVVSNVHLYAGGLAELSPNAWLDDGIMDLWIFEGKTLGDTVQAAWDLWAGRHVQSQRVHLIPFRKALIESDSPMYVQLDGEPMIGNGCINIEVCPRALRVLVPENTPRPLFKKNSLTKSGNTR